MAKKKLKNIPRTRGETHLAYITAAEDALLRARDKKKGVKKAKFSPEGIPVLGEGRGDQSVIDAQEKENIKQRDARQAKLDKGWTREWEGGGEGGGGREWLVAPKEKVSADTSETSETTTGGETTTTGGETTTTGGETTTSTTTATTTLPKYVAPKKKETPAAEARPAYSGPAYDPSESITPTGITLQPVQDAEFVENRLNELLDKDSPLFRQAAESKMRQMAGRGLGRNASMSNEAVWQAVMAVAGPIAEADARMLERHRTLNNTAYHQQMNTRLAGVIQKALTHIAGGYDIQAATMKDITDRWKAQVDADLKEYGVDVSAAVSKYGTDVGFAKTKYVADIQERLGLAGVKIGAAEILAGIEDNTESVTYIWDLIFGENMNVSDWLVKWKDHWEDEEEVA